MNPFESGARKVIPATLIYARCGDRILLIHRNAEARANDTRPGPGKEVDYHSGKWNGLGGKLELDESPLQAGRREFHEEAGLDLPEERFRTLGFLQFPNFKAHKHEDWLVFVMIADVTEEEAAKILRASAEGDLHWVPVSDFDRLKFWPGDREFLPFVLKQKSFVGTFWYAGKELSRFWISGM